MTPLYPFSMTDALRREFEGPGPNVLDFVDRRALLDGAPPPLARRGDLQEVRLPDDEVVDIGHVLAGLDAINHPAVVAPLGLYEMSSDVDAYAIGAAYDIGRDAGRAVSDILLDYSGAPATSRSPRACRFTTFALDVGLGPLDGGAFAAEPARLTRYEREVAHAAALYVGATSELAVWGLSYGVGAKLGLMRAARNSPWRRTLLERFVTSLNAEVAREAAAA